MRSEEEIRAALRVHERWMDQWEGQGASEEGVVLGNIKALEWVLGEDDD